MPKKSTRNWLDLPSDLMLNILQRVGVIDRLQNAQKVCTAWHEIYKDPAMWRVIYMRSGLRECDRLVYRDMFKQAVDRSQGQLVDLTVINFCDDELLRYVADRSSQLRRLEIAYYVVRKYGIWSDAFKKLSLLEELKLFGTKVSLEDIEAAGRYCPFLITFKVHNKKFMKWDKNGDDVALAIGENLPKLTRFELTENNMPNVGLQAILDGCRHLESLDKRRCLCVDLDVDLGKRCSDWIKHLKLPHDSFDWCTPPSIVLAVFDSESESESEAESESESEAEAEAEAESESESESEAEAEAEAEFESDSDSE